MIRLHGTEKRPASQAADYTGFKVLRKKEKKKEKYFPRRKEYKESTRGEENFFLKKKNTLNLSQPCSTIPIKIWDTHKI